MTIEFKAGESSAAHSLARERIVNQLLSIVMQEPLEEEVLPGELPALETRLDRHLIQTEFQRTPRPKIKMHENGGRPKSGAANERQGRLGDFPEVGVQSLTKPGQADLPLEMPTARERRPKKSSGLLTPRAKHAIDYDVVKMLEAKGIDRSYDEITVNDVLDFLRPMSHDDMLEMDGVGPKIANEFESLVHSYRYYMHGAGAEAMNVELEPINEKTQIGHADLAPGMIIKFEDTRELGGFYEGLIKGMKAFDTIKGRERLGNKVIKRLAKDDDGTYPLYIADALLEQLAPIVTHPTKASKFMTIAALPAKEEKLGMPLDENAVDSIPRRGDRSGQSGFASRF